MRIMLIAAAVAGLAACTSGAPPDLVAGANSTPGFVQGQVPTVTQWNGYFGTKVDAANGQLTNPQITGGTIDGAVIGGTTPAAASFTTVTLQGLTFTLSPFPSGTASYYVCLSYGGAIVVQGSACQGGAD